MNLPFSFAMTATAINGILWNSAGSDTTAIANAYRPSPDPAPRRVHLLGFSIVSDTVSAQCKIGVYNQTTSVFTAKYTVNATGLASGGEVRTEYRVTGIRLELYDPANPTHVIVPAIQLITGATLNLSGDIQFDVPGESNDVLTARLDSRADGTQSLAQEENGTNELEEDNATTIHEE